VSYALGPDIPGIVELLEQNCRDRYIGLIDINRIQYLLEDWRKKDAALAAMEPTSERSKDYARIFVGLARREDKDGLPYWDKDWLVERLADALDHLRVAVRVDEREACARVAEEITDNHVVDYEVGEEIVDAIRARQP
jgi:hypothetical protein